jgi:hypothetical protein
MSRRLFIASFFDAGLVNEHYRDVVFDEINAFTFDAFQGAPIRLQLDLGFASRTREYFQKFLTNCHGLTFLSGSTGMLKAYHKNAPPWSAVPWHRFGQSAAKAAHSKEAHI